MAPPPMHCHSPHMALPLWVPLITDFWRSHRLLKKRPVLVLRQARSSNFALLSPLLGRSLPALRYHRLIPSPAALPEGWAWLCERQPQKGSGSRSGNMWPVFALRKGSLHLPRDTPLPEGRLCADCCSYLPSCGQRRGRYLAWVLDPCSLSSQCCCNLPGPTHRSRSRMCSQNCRVLWELDMVQRGKQRF